MPAKVCVEFTESDGETPEPAVKSYVATIGDGTNVSYTVTHGLGTADVLYGLRNLTTGEVDSYDVAATASANALGLVFTTPPPANSVRVVVIAA